MRPDQLVILMLAIAIGFALSAWVISGLARWVRPVTG